MLLSDLKNSRGRVQGTAIVLSNRLQTANVEILYDLANKMACEDNEGRVIN